MATGQERDRHPSSPPPPPPTSPPEDPSVEKPMDVAKEPEKDYRQVPGSRLVELAGDTTTVELSDNNRVVELESPADVKRPIEP